MFYKSMKHSKSMEVKKKKQLLTQPTEWSLKQNKEQICFAGQLAASER